MGSEEGLRTRELDRLCRARLCGARECVGGLCVGDWGRAACPPGHGPQPQRVDCPNCIEAPCRSSNFSPATDAAKLDAAKKTIAGTYKTDSERSFVMVRG